MSGSPPPPPPKSLACQRDPGLWFDRRRRGDALVQCLRCAERPWCAQEALRWRASWGMWAGVWIDERHDDAVPYLQAIAAGEAARTDRRAAVATTTARHDSPALPALPAPPPLRRPSTPQPSRSPAAAVLARSSGHCEVFTESCRYTCDRYVGRCVGEAGTENPSPAELFAACAQCAELVAGLDRPLATRWGYVVEAGRDPASVPFHWRGSRWVLLARDGWLTEISEDAQTA